MLGPVTTGHGEVLRDFGLRKAQAVSSGAGGGADEGGELLAKFVGGGDFQHAFFLVELNARRLASDAGPQESTCMSRSKGGTPYKVVHLVGCVASWERAHMSEGRTDRRRTP